MANTAVLISLVLLSLMGHSQQQERHKRQFPNNFDEGIPQDLQLFNNNFDNARVRVRVRVQRQNPLPGQELIFSHNEPRASINSLTNPTPRATPGAGLPVFINNLQTVATVPPFITPTTASPAFMNCFNSCPTTPEYNPICGSNQQLYFNEQKFNCALRCGANVQIVRRGSCAGLFPMQRG